jgi:hypothetical protein
MGISFRRTIMSESNEYRFKVGEFWSSANPNRKVLCLAVDDEIESHEKHGSFIRWMDAVPLQGAHPDLSNPEYVKHLQLEVLNLRQIAKRWDYVLNHVAVSDALWKTIPPKIKAAERHINNAVDRVIAAEKALRTGPKKTGIAIG